MIQTLLIEDSPKDTLAIEQALNQADQSPVFRSFKVTNVGMMGQGLSLLRERSFDAVLLDLDLPDARDFEGIDLVKKEFPRIPIIVLTKQREEIEIAIEALKRGAQDYFNKSQLNDLSALARVVRYAIERKKAEEALVTAREEALQAAKAKSEFLANMSHDIRTPLNCIIGVADLLSRAHLSEENRNHVKMLSRASDNLLALINNVLDISKIEAGKVSLAVERFDLLETVEGILDIIATRAHAKNLEVIFKMDPELARFRVGDPGLINQILVNLLGNAVKFTKTGEVTLELKRVRMGDDPNAIQFCVSDTGVGIPEDKISYIFESFSQLENPHIAVAQPGVGLGLAICKKLTELMRGKIRVQSEIGVGSRFEMELPLPVAPEMAVASAPALIDLTGIRVLVTDDNPAQLLLLQEILLKWGASVRCARHHAEAEMKCAKQSSEGQPFDVAILDLRMPGIQTGGFELAAKIRSQVKSIVMMLPTNHRTGDIEKLKEAGVEAYLFKPVKPDKLAHLLSEVLGHTKRLAAVDSSRKRAPRQPDSLRVLVADDSEDNRQLVSAYFKGEGIALELARDGQEAFDIFKKHPFDLVLMDIQMPTMDGYQALSAMRTWERAKGRAQVPIVALTAFALKDEAEKCLTAGFGAHVTKPLTKGHLMEVVRRFAAS